MKPIPTPFPTAGIPADLEPSFAHKDFIDVWVSSDTPDFGRFSRSRGLRAARGVRPCSPNTSLVAVATNGFTDGRVLRVKDIVSFTV